MKSTCQILLFAIVFTLYRRARGLQCYSCSGEDYCKWMIKKYPQRVGRCHVDDGKCFVRRDPNGEVYLGCINDAFWPGVPWRWYKNCGEDWQHGWVFNGAKRPITWCVCDDHDDCNVNIGDAGSRPSTTSPGNVTTAAPGNATTAATDNATEQTQDPMMTTPPSELTTTSTNVTCPTDYRQAVGETSCYKVVSPTLSDVSGSLDYFQATNACQSSGGHLVSIESIEEQRHLANLLRTQPEILQGWQGWWTSGQLMAGTNLFVWRSSNRPVLVDRRLWGFVQSPLRDTCIWIMSIPYFNFTLGNYDCSTRAGYICEIDS